MALVVAQDADRITRDPGHRMLLDEEFDRRGSRLKALDDWGDESHEGQLLKFLRGWVSKGERLKIAERTRRGRRQKSKQGLLVAPSTVPYGFRLNEARDGYLVDDEKMAVVRRMFQMVADGADGIAWASRHDWKVLGRERRLDGTYRDVREHAEKPREEWIALPVPDSGIPREVAERARHNLELKLPAPKAERRVWELSGGFATCAECGRGMSGHTVAPKGRKRGPYHYYLCTRKNPLGVYTLTPDRIRYPADEELAAKRLATEADRGARFRELYAKLALRAAVHADGTLEITVGATSEATKGVMPCNESSSRSTTSTQT